jgi:hypothetical protein
MAMTGRPYARSGEAIVLKPVTEESLKRLQGKGVLKSLMEERRKDTGRT